MTPAKKHTGLPLARILPPEACALLQAAAREPPESRARAIDAAIDKVKLKYPQFFKSEKE